MNGHTETGTCALCGAALTTYPIIFAGYLTCNMANDGREHHTGAELRAYWTERSTA